MTMLVPSMVIILIMTMRVMTTMMPEVGFTACTKQQKNFFMPFNSGGLIDVKREHALLPGIGVSKMNGATANSDKRSLY